MFVKLTGEINGKPVYINACKVTAVYESIIDDYTLVNTAKGQEWKVKESPETVVMLLNSALKGR